MLNYFLLLLFIIFSLQKNELFSADQKNNSSDEIPDAVPGFEFNKINFCINEIPDADIGFEFSGVFFTDEVKKIINEARTYMNNNDLFKGDFEKYYEDPIQKGDLNLLFDWFATRDKDGSNTEILNTLLRTGHVDINKYELIKWAANRSNYALFKFLIDNGAIIPPDIKAILNDRLNDCDRPEYMETVFIWDSISKEDIKKMKMKIISEEKEKIKKMISLLEH